MTELQIKAPDNAPSDDTNLELTPNEHLLKTLYWAFSETGTRDQLILNLDRQPGFYTAEHIEIAIIKGLSHAAKAPIDSTLNDHEAALRQAVYGIIDHEDGAMLTPEFVPTHDAVTTAALFALKHRITARKSDALEIYSEAA